MWKIRQHPSGWEVLDPNGSIIDRCGTYSGALVVVASAVRDALVAAGTDSPGLLPEAWVDSGGIALAEPTGPHRDFTNVQWSWRDPSAGFVPLMFAAKPEGEGHAGSELAGFVERFSENGRTVHASGRFYDSEVGRQLRDMLLDGRIMGVSVDPSENWDAEFICTEEDADGFCIDGMVSFITYEIAGVTAHPFPGLSRAAIELVPTADEQPAMAAAAALVVPGDVPLAFAAVPVAPPAEWFDDPQLTGPTPMTVTDDGRIFGHLACWGTCHISYEDVCVTPPVSEAEYAYFRTGEVVCADRTRVPTGALTMGIGHASLEVSAAQAVAHYDDTTHGVADLASGEDLYGIWIAGAIRPDLTDAQLRTLRAASPSGDWRRLRGALELVAALCVNVPGFPVPRVQARTASGVCTAFIAAGPTRPNAEAEMLAALAFALNQASIVEQAMGSYTRPAADMHLGRIQRATARRALALWRDRRTIPAEDRLTP